MRAVSKAVAAASLLALLLSWGCQPKPKAPALIDEPVYQSSEGFRFLVPEEWTMIGRASPPTGRVEKECLLVQYRRSSGDSDAMVEISLMDLPEDADLLEYLSRPSFSVRRWKSLGQPESIEAGGASGTCYRFSGRAGKSDLAKEVIVFRRGGRVYFFTVLYSPKDATAVEQVRRSINGLTWTK